MSLEDKIKGRISQILQSGQGNSAQKLNEILRLLGKWRCNAIQLALIKQHGAIVMQGPFEGLKLTDRSAEGCHIPKLLGCYEQPLFPHLERAILANYDTILNIGCAEGYYAIGMARRLPGATIYAYDVNPSAQAACAELASRNDVKDRVKIGGLFSPADFSSFANNNTLIVCDIEGGEKALLNPEISPALRKFDLIVEIHECMEPGLTKEMVRRFSGTHEITVIMDSGQRQLKSIPEWFVNLSNLDQLLAVWEWRSGPTPWLVMRARKESA